MKSKQLMNLVLTTAIFLVATPLLVEAQTPIQNLRTSQGMMISGEVKSIVGNKFILEDGTGQIIVDAGPRWWKEINLSPGETVTVNGEMGRDEFDAFSITRQNGSVIDIRPTDGPPPWSGGRRKN